MSICDRLNTISKRNVEFKVKPYDDKFGVYVSVFCLRLSVLNHKASNRGTFLGNGFVWFESFDDQYLRKIIAAELQRAY